MNFLQEDRRTNAPDAVVQRIDSITDNKQLTNNILNTKDRVRNKRYTHLRMSELDAACPREWTLGYTLTKTVQARVAFSQATMMDMGTALHYWLQNHSNYFKGQLLGYWTCQACQTLRRFGLRPEDKCEICGASHRATTYEEYMFRYTSPYRVVGKTDGIIKVGNVHRFIDIKTTGKPIESPAKKDIVQLTGLIHFHQFDEGHMKLPITIDRSCGYLIYFHKTFNFRNPAIVFEVRPDKTSIDSIVAKAQAFTDGANSGTLPPPLNPCFVSNFTIGRATNCPMVKHCKDFMKVPNVYKFFGDGYTTNIEDYIPIDHDKEKESVE